MSKVDNIYREQPFYIADPNIFLYSMSAQTVQINVAQAEGFCLLNPFVPPGTLVTIDGAMTFEVKGLSPVIYPVLNSIKLYIPATAVSSSGTWAITTTERLKVAFFQYVDQYLFDFTPASKVAEYALQCSVSAGAGGLVDYCTVVNGAPKLTIRPEGYGAGFLDPFNTMVYSEYLNPRYHYRILSFVGVADPFRFDRVYSFRLQQDGNQANNGIFRVRLYE